jgi:hypothetical protein
MLVVALMYSGCGACADECDDDDASSTPAATPDPLPVCADIELFSGTLTSNPVELTLPTGGLYGTYRFVVPGWSSGTILTARLLQLPSPGEELVDAKFGQESSGLYGMSLCVNSCISFADSITIGFETYLSIPDPVSLTSSSRDGLFGDTLNVSALDEDSVRLELSSTAETGLQVYYCD